MGARTGVFPIVNMNTPSRCVYQVSHGNNRDYTPRLKKLRQIYNFLSHIGRLMIICSLYTTFISRVKYILYVCNVFVLTWITVAAIDRISLITLKTNRRLRQSRSSDRLPRNNWPQFFLQNVIRKKSSDKCLFPMMTSVCSTSEYRTII